MYLLDSSAWLVHMLGETGMEQINDFFEDEEAEVSISVLSIPEVYGRVKSLGREDHWNRLWQGYQQAFTRVLSVNEIIAHRAVSLRQATPTRLPTVDGLIAATATVYDLTLVHRDAHLGSIPSHLLQQIELQK